MVHLIPPLGTLGPPRLADRRGEAAMTVSGFPTGFLSRLALPPSCYAQSSFSARLLTHDSFKRR
jgi:hypothetical protein